MPVTEQTPVNTHNGNGVTTVFAYSFLLLDADDMEVTVDGAVITTGYSVSGVGNPSGGSVTFVSAPASGVENMILRRSMAYDRTETDYQENGDLQAETLDNDIDRVIMMVQQLASDFKRALKLSKGTTTDQTISGTAAERSGTFVSFDSLGNMILAKIADTGSTVISLFGSSLLTAINAAAARTTLGLGTAATKDTGTSAGNVVALDGSAKLPAVDGSQLTGVGGSQIFTISASVAGNALTISAPSMSLDFRSATLTSGAVTRVSGTPANLVVPANATLGTISGAVARLIYIALNNAGTIELAVVNQSGGTNLDETGVISTTAISAASNSANVVYSTTARTNVAYRVIGYLEETSATAGQWNTLGPFSLQGSGGQALTSMHSIGQWQTWQNVSGSRTYGTTYYNTTGKPICVKVAAANSSTGYYLYLSATVNGLQISNEGCWAQSGLTVWVRDTFIVPPGGSYSVAVTGADIQYWSELR